MKKKLLILLLSVISCLVLVFGLSACGDSGNSSNTGGNQQGTTQNPPDTGNESGGGNEQKPNEPQTISVEVWLEGKVVQTLITDEGKGNKITMPTTPADITTNQNLAKYFYGWYLDDEYKTPLSVDATFQSDSKIYGRMLDIKPNEFEYSIENNSITITGFKDTSATYVVIPSNIENIPVKTLTNSVFLNNKNLEIAVVLNGAETVSGFRGCSNLTEALLPDSIIVIDDYCFSGCVQLKI